MAELVFTKTKACPECGCCVEVETWTCNCKLVRLPLEAGKEIWLHKPGCSKVEHFHSLIRSCGSSGSPQYH